MDFLTRNQEACKDLSFVLECDTGGLVLRRLTPQVLLLTVNNTIPGMVAGQLFEHLKKASQVQNRVKIFIDLGSARGLPATVNAWITFLKQHWAAIEGVYVYAPSKEAYLAASIVQHLTGEPGSLRVIKARTIFNTFLRFATTRPQNLAFKTDTRMNNATS